MKITILLKGTLKQYGEPSQEVILPEGSSCDEALQAIGINYLEIKRFGFVAINSKRVMIYDKLEDGDELKAWSSVSGG
ncbi:MAG: MoaD/ThiS family protein [Anaerovoracaceae bacterium]